MNIVLLGPPGSGKGTQGDLISEKYRIPRISTGDIFREELRDMTPLGRKAGEYINNGLLVPDEITNMIVKARISSLKGFILDGYPRTVGQAEFLDSFCRIDHVLYYHINKDIVVSRISGRRTCASCKRVYNIMTKPPRKEGICDVCGGKLAQRQDELPGTIEKRLLVYEKETRLLVDYYAKKGMLSKIDASKSIGEVFAKTEKILS